MQRRINGATKQGRDQRAATASQIPPDWISDELRGMARIQRDRGQLGPASLDLTDEESCSAAVYPSQSTTTSSLFADGPVRWIFVTVVLPSFVEGICRTFQLLAVGRSGSRADF